MKLKIALLLAAVLSVQGIQADLPQTTPAPASAIPDAPGLPGQLPPTADCDWFCQFNKAIQNQPAPKPVKPTATQVEQQIVQLPAADQLTVLQDQFAALSATQQQTFFAQWVKASQPVTIPTSLDTNINGWLQTLNQAIVSLKNLLQSALTNAALSPVKDQLRSYLKNQLMMIAVSL